MPRWWMSWATRTAHTDSKEAQLVESANLLILTSLSTLAPQTGVGQYRIICGLLLPFSRIAEANNLLQSMPVGRLSSAFAVDITGPAWLNSLGRFEYIRTKWTTITPSAITCFRKAART